MIISLFSPLLTKKNNGSNAIASDYSFFYVKSRNHKIEFLTIKI